MIETGAGICVYKYEAEIKWFYLFFTYLFLFARGGKYSPIRIHQKVFNATKLKLFEKETRNCE